MQRYSCGGNRRKEICDALSDLVPFILFKKHGKHPWTSVTKSATNF